MVLGLNVACWTMLLNCSKIAMAKAIGYRTNYNDVRCFAYDLLLY